MALNLSKNHDSLVNAWRDVVDDKSSTNWAVFGYEGQTNTLHVVATGDGTLEEMAEHLSAGKCMYALCHVKDPKTTLRKNALIIWQGEGAPDTRKGVCANHVRPIADLLKGTHVTFTARTDDEVEPEFIMDKVIKASSSKFDFDTSHRGMSPPPGPVGSVYKKIDPSLILKERDEYLQNQQRQDMEERHQVEHQRRKSQQEELQQITRNRQASIEEEGEKRAPHTAINTTNNPVAAALESKNYVNLQRKNWEEAQKTASVKPQLEKKPVRPFVAPTPAPPKPPHQMQKPAGFGPKGTLTPRVVLAPKKVNDPDVKAREEEERRRWEQSQKESENEEKERRLKAEQMRQERLKEVQALVSARRQSEDLTDEYSNTKTRTVSQASENKSRSSSSSVAVAVDNDVAMQAYRDEERRKFEQSQRESEKDEQERRHRSESLRQERLRELAALTQSKDAAKDNFSALGQTVKENRGKGKKGEDPDLLARREEEKRRFEEAQREAHEEDNERKNKAEMLRQQRAQEAASLVAHRTSSAKAAFLEKTSPKEEQPPSTFESRQRSGSAQQAARALFEHSSAAQHQHTATHVPSKVPLTPQTSQSSIGQEQPEVSPTDTDYIHPSQRALPPLPHELNGHSNGRRDSGDRYERQTSGHEHMKHDHYETNGHNGVPKHQEPERHHVANKTQVREDEVKPDNVQVSPTHAVNAWKQGLPVRPPSDDEHEHDEEAWNEPEKVHHGVISPSLSSTSSSGQSQGLHARALYDYQAADETEISFDPGDIITHVDKIDPGWYQGMAPSGAFGLFPANYVEMLT